MKPFVSAYCIGPKFTLRVNEGICLINLVKWSSESPIRSSRDFNPISSLYLLLYLWLSNQEKGFVTVLADTNI